MRFVYLCVAHCGVLSCVELCVAHRFMTYIDLCCVSLIYVLRCVAVVTSYDYFYVFKKLMMRSVDLRCVSPNYAFLFYRRREIGDRFQGFVASTTAHAHSA